MRLKRKCLPKALEKRRPLTPAQKTELVLRVQAGDARSFDRLLEADAKLLVSRCSRWLNGDNASDLFHEAVLGYRTAVLKWREDGGANLATVAVLQVDSEVRRYAEENNSHSVVRRPVYLFTKHREWDHLKEFRDIGFATPLARGGPSMTLASILPCDQRNPEELYWSRRDAVEAKKLVTVALEQIHPGDRYIIELRFLREPPLSLAQVAEKLNGVTRELIRQLQHKALMQLVPCIFRMLEVPFTSEQVRDAVARVCDGTRFRTHKE